MKIILLSLFSIMAFSASYSLKCGNQTVNIQTKQGRAGSSVSFYASPANIESCSEQLKVFGSDSLESQVYNTGSPFCPAAIGGGCDFSSVVKNARLRTNQATGTCVTGTGSCSATCGLESGQWESVNTSSCSAMTTTTAAATTTATASTSAVTTTLNCNNGAIAGRCEGDASFDFQACYDALVPVIASTCPCGSASRSGVNVRQNKGFFEYYCTE